MAACPDRFQQTSRVRVLKLRFYVFNPEGFERSTDNVAHKVVTFDRLIPRSRLRFPDAGEATPGKDGS